MKEYLILTTRYKDLNFGGGVIYFGESIAADIQQFYSVQGFIQKKKPLKSLGILATRTFRFISPISQSMDMILISLKQKNVLYNYPFCIQYQKSLKRSLLIGKRMEDNNMKQLNLFREIIVDIFAPELCVNEHMNRFSRLKAN